MQASFSNIEALPLVNPCPYIATSTAPSGISLAELFAIASSVICSSESYILFHSISPVFIHGILPSKYSGCFLEGVPPEVTLVISLSFSLFHSLLILFSFLHTLVNSPLKAFSNIADFLFSKSSLASSINSLALSNFSKRLSILSTILCCSFNGGSGTSNFSNLPLVI